MMWDSSISSRNCLAQIRSITTPSQASQAFLWVLLLQGFQPAPPSWTHYSSVPDFPADSSWTPMQTTSVCINGRNGSDKWRQQVWFCNCLRLFGAEGGFGRHHNLHPRGRAGGGSGGHHHPHPHRKAGSRDKRGRSSSRQAPTPCSGCVAGAGRFPNKE